MGFHGDYLKEKRIENGLATTEFCAKIGISEATYYRKMHKGGDFSRAEIDAITRVLHLSADEQNAIFFAL